VTGTVHAGTPEDPIRIATDWGPARLYFDRVARGSGNPGWVLLYRKPDASEVTEVLVESRRNAHRRAEIEACAFLNGKGLR
jgi:hypothetical protein